MRILHTIGLCDAQACFHGTRIPVWVVIRESLATNAHTVLRLYPELTLQDIRDAWDYYDNHREEIESDLTESALA